MAKRKFTVGLGKHRYVSTTEQCSLLELLALVHLKLVETSPLNKFQLAVHDNNIHALQSGFDIISNPNDITSVIVCMFGFIQFPMKMIFPSPLRTRVIRHLQDRL